MPRENTEAIGQRIRWLRQRKNITLRDFARRIEVSPGHISQFERNLIEPSLSVLRRISSALDVPVPILLGGDSEDVFLAGRNTGKPYTFLDSAGTYRFHTPYQLANGRSPQVNLIVLCLPGHTRDHEDFVAHDSEEYAYVLRGRVEYHTEHNVFCLRAGDGLYLESRTHHYILNPEAEEAELLGVMDAPWNSLSKSTS